MKKNIKLKTVMTCTIVFIILTLLSLAISGVFVVRRTVHSDIKSYNEIATPLQLLVNSTNKSQKVRVSIRDIIISNDSKEIETHTEKILALKADIDKLIKTSYDGINSKETIKALDKFTKTYSQSDAFIQNTIQMARQNRDSEAMAYISEKGDAGIHAKKLEEEGRAVIFKMLEEGKSTIEKDNETAMSSIVVMIIIVLSISILLAYIGHYIISRLVRPICIIKKL